ncbi:hypothetical protein RD110_11270 [Rhodoferax koreense]|uniref:diguanylate cyclase n=1 Tax=Rhodoferax koreensis TaxID=1842727 RepID=A0A1P8JV95_9BURK|nr:diguanylate cyclase [Rhodoferax koreense]APW37706.1 hypothetical protein RD110_11270 [Rhodoferax koreense]
MKRQRQRSHNFARASYGPRVVGLGLGLLSVAGVLATRETPWWVWAGPLLHGLVWPHLAWLWSRHCTDSVRAERRNLVIDHFFGGVWIATMAFNALPSVLMLTLMGMDSMIAGGWRQFARGMLAHAAGMAAGMLVYGAHWAPESDMVQVLACLPLLLLHPISVGQITYRALTKLKRQREELAHLSQHDGLTGLYNRRHWEHMARIEFARFRRSGEIATLVLVDLDHFKRVNDTLGHAAGDTVLRGFAERLQQTLRKTDTPGRYGGEEFGILLPHTGPREASELMQRLQAGLSTDPLLPQRVVTASFGVAALTRDLPNHEAWMRLADQMLYRAKDRGRDCVVTAGDSRPSPLAPDGSPALRLREDASVMRRVLAGLNLGDIGAALFDPSDRLVWANAIFLKLYDVSAEARSFAEIMRHCHRRQVGPRIDAEDIDVWLAAADAKRRSRPRRSFSIDMLDGRYFRVEEMSFDDGWLLDLWTEISAEQARLTGLTPVLPVPPVDGPPIPPATA